MKENRAVTPKTSLNAGWPAEAETSWITEHKDDPEEDCGRNCGRNWDSTVTQKAEVSAVMGKLKVRTDNCNVEAVKQAQERSQNGDQ